MAFALPSSFWPTVYRLARGREWPPESDEDAEALLDRVVPEGLLSLLIAEAELPPPVSRAIGRFRALDRSNELRMRVFEQSLEMVAHVLEGERIIVFKGTDYAYRLYPAPHLRPRQDIDLLVPRARAAAIFRRLLESGAKLHFPAGAIARVPSYHEAVFEVGNATVEIHHSIVQRTRNRVDYDGIWRRARPWKGFDSRLLQFDDADALLAHAINMISDQFSCPIFRHLDVWLLLRETPDVVPLAVERAHAWLTRRALYGALRQTSRYFPEFRGAAVEEALQALVKRKSRAFLDRRVLPDPWSPRRYGRAGQLWKKLWLIDDWPHRVGFFAYHLYASVAGAFLELRARRNTNRLLSPS